MMEGKTDFTDKHGRNPRPTKPPTFGRCPDNPCPPPMPPQPNRPNLTVGESWYVKHEGGSTLAEYKIIDVTDHTVLIKDRKRSTGASRYKIADLEGIKS